MMLFYLFAFCLFFVSGLLSTQPCICINEGTSCLVASPISLKYCILTKQLKVIGIMHPRAVL